MNETTRRRTLWVLGAIVAAYAIGNVVMFYTTDSFGPVWFAASLLVYGVFFVAAIVLAFTDTDERGREEHVVAEVDRPAAAARATDA